MNASKNYLNRSHLILLILQAGVVAAIALPQLAPQRAMAEEALHLQEGMLWIPLLGLLLLATVCSLLALRKRLSGPLQHLVQQTKLGTTSFAFKNKSYIAEEDYLKHFIEGQALKFAELEQEIQGMQSEVEKAAAISKVSPDEYRHLQNELEKSRTQIETLTEQIQAQQKERSRLESDLRVTEKALRHSQRDIDEMEYKAANGQFPSGSADQLSLESCREALESIDRQAWKLAKAWAETPPAKFRDALQEIHQTTRSQLDQIQGR